MKLYYVAFPAKGQNTVIGGLKDVPLANKHRLGHTHSKADMENLPDEDAERSQLIRKTAHDVRTPLTSIAGFAELIAEDDSVSENVRKYAGIIVDEVRKLSATLEGFFEKIRDDDQADHV